MSDPGNLKPNPDEPMPSPPPGHEPEDDLTFKLAEEVTSGPADLHEPMPSPPPGHEPEDDLTFKLAEEVTPGPADPPGDLPGGPPPLAEWYTGSPGGQREGPFTLLEMKQRIAAGTITGEALVWKDGMADWTPARGIGELFETPGSPPPPPAAVARRTDFTEYFQAADRLFAKPSFFRTTGRVCALLAVLVLLVSIILWPFARHLTWFTGAVLLALIFFVGEAAGAILERLDGE